LSTLEVALEEDIRQFIVQIGDVNVEGVHAFAGVVEGNLASLAGGSVLRALRVAIHVISWNSNTRR
jgi:hypothetical protein